MAKTRISDEEIIKIANLMKSVPIEEEESNNAYFKRLMGCARRSRTTLQIIQQAVSGAKNDEEICANYEAIIYEKNKKKADNKKQKKVKALENPEQEKMILPEIEPCEKETIEICGLIIEISIKTKGRKQ